MTRKYIGTKIITGYALEKDGKPGYGVIYQDGYQSWSPKDVFEEAYRPCEAMTFGLALEALKKGLRVARAGWNGKGMWLSLSCDGVREVAAENFWSPHNAEFARSCPNGTAMVQPCITMKNAQGQIQMGWAATQSDMLAEDWQVV